MFDPVHPIAGLRPADYNPRVITADVLRRLQESITNLGFCKNIVVTESGLILAGHQRTKAATALGLSTCPAYVLATKAEMDEVRFNQLHNGTDLDCPEPVHVPPSSVEGWATIPGAAVEGNLRSIGAATRKDTADLIAKYGPWGNAVATQDGTVICNGQYALTAKLLGCELRVYYVSQERAQAGAGYLTQEYGRFSYAHLPKQTWNQTFAQLYRLRTSTDHMVESVLYREDVIPWLIDHPKARVLDFGCGQGDYVRSLAKKGYAIQGVEFYARTGQSIDLGKVAKMVHAVADGLRTRGRWDAVVLDSVLNSTDSQAAEDALLGTLRALCRPGGRVFFSARDRAPIGGTRSTKDASASGKSQTRFLDDSGYTASITHGSWFYQRFHTTEQMTAMVGLFGGTSADVRRRQGCFQCAVTNARPQAAEEAEAALAFEFNLPLPGGRSHGYDDLIVDAWRKRADP